MDMSTKILKVIKLHLVPTIAARAPRMLTTKRSTQRGIWRCDICNTDKPESVRWYLHRGSSRGVRAKPKTRMCAECARRVFLCPVCGFWRVRAAGAEPRWAALRVGSAASREHAICTACVTQHYYTCSACQVQYAKDPAYTDGDSLYCSKCVSAFCVCGGCGVRKPPKHLTPLGLYTLCESCRAEYTPETDGHSAKPEPHFYTSRTLAAYLHAARPGELYMGVELEIDDGRRARTLCRDLSTFPQLYLKRDGSLSALGIEVVSHPATLEVHKKQYAWDSVLGLCRKHDYKSFDAKQSCGIHIHINRSFMDARYNKPDTVVLADDSETSVNFMKLLCFVYGHAAQYKLLAQRENKEYAAFSTVHRARDIGPTTNLRKCARLKQPGDLLRYQALNFNNADTVEWRIFRGTLHYETFMAYLELVDATCRFVLQSGVGMLMHHHSSWSAFCKYVVDHKHYTHLVGYMKGKQVWNT